MVTLRRTTLLALATVVATVMAAGPAHADAAEGFTGTGNARALHISVLGKDVTFGVTDANVGSTLSAAANAAGQLLQPNSTTRVSLSRDNSTATDPTDGKQKCAVPSLPAPLSSLLDAQLACSLVKADITGGAPHAIGSAGVASLTVDASSLLKNLPVDLQLGNTLKPVTDQLAPVLKAVSDATNNQVNLTDTSTITDLLNALTTQQALTVQLGQSTTDVTTVASNLTSASTALGGTIKVLPIAALGNKPLATITIGSAKTSAVYDRVKGVSTASYDPALVTVELASILGLPAQTLKVAPGQTITLLEGTPLESTITVADGQTESSANGAKAVADGVSLNLLKGLSLPTGSSGVTTAAASGPGAVVVELAHTEAQVTGNPASKTPVANPTPPAPADVKALAFTGTSPWLPIGGFALIGAAWGTRRLRRRITA